MMELKLSDLIHKLVSRCEGDESVDLSRNWVTMLLSWSRNIELTMPWPESLETEEQTDNR